jgi:hypothetical protein
VASGEAEEGFEAWGEHEAGYEYEHELEWEYENRGLWVGTVGAVEAEWGEETPVDADALALLCSESPPRERGIDERIEERSDFQGEGDSAEEVAGDEWWDLRAGSPYPESVGISTVQARPPHRSPHKTPRTGHSSAAGEQWIRREQESNVNQQWEEARQHARQRQLASSGLSSEDEEQQGEWRLKPHEPP